MSSNYITKIITAKGSKQIDYNALANLPDLERKADLGYDGKVPANQLPDMLPTVSATDNGKFLRVVNGTWAATTMANAEEASF